MADKYEEYEITERMVSEAIDIMHAAIRDDQDPDVLVCSIFGAMLVSKTKKSTRFTFPNGEGTIDYPDDDKSNQMVH